MDASASANSASTDVVLCEGQATDCTCATALAVVDDQTFAAQ